MPLPTLMLKGKLRPPTDDDTIKKILDEYVPLEYIMKWFYDRLKLSGAANKVLILKSETASGKSTALPPEIFKKFVYNNPLARNIICTQPRIITAIENVNEMLKHYSKYMTLGKTIGWSTKSNKFKPTEVGLLSATIGTLLQLMKTNTDEQIIEKYQFILIDEVHERDLPTDMSIMMLKEFVYRNADNPKCPFIVLMSATFDPINLLSFFGISINTNFIWCVGETAGFDEIWDWNNNKDVSNYTKAAAEVVGKIISENEKDPPEKADILIFLPGASEFKETYKELVKLNEQLAEKNKPVFSLLQIDSPAVRTQNIDYANTMYISTDKHEVTIKNNRYKASRRVILTTNIAETGLTLDNLKYVIDAGYNREIEYNPILNIRGLITKPAPKSRIKQRRGRAGRKFRGVFYPLYTKEVFDKIQEIQYPQIIVEDVSTILLSMIVEQLKSKHKAGQLIPAFSTNDVDMVDCPSSHSLHYALEKLYSLGFFSIDSIDWMHLESKLEISTRIDKIIANEHKINKNVSGLTILGCLAYEFSLIPLESIRMILSAYYWEPYILDVVTIAAYLLMKPNDFFDGPKNGSIIWDAVYSDGLPKYIDRNNIYMKMKEYLFDDFITGLIIFNAIQHVLTTNAIPLDALIEWCKKNNVSYNACMEFIKIRDDIIEQLLSAKLNIYSGEEFALAFIDKDEFANTITKIKHCIYDGYRNNYLLYDGARYITSMGINVNVNVEKLSITPRVLLFQEIALKFNEKTNIYKARTVTVSMMDGFVTMDTKFTI